MAVEKINIDDFINLSDAGIVIDVRSPGEFEHAHIPDAKNLPLFSNEERAQVGTTYKKNSRAAAIKLALPFFGDKMLPMVELVESWVADYSKKQDNKVPILYVHCWRGGMRSAAIAWLLDLYGWKVCQLIGGYKTYRNWTLQQFECHYNFKILGGYTGSGKTETLLTLKKRHQQVIDLEGLACHKGSAFGALGQATPPSQEMFENKLGRLLFEFSKTKEPIWMEDESQRIGTVMIPTNLFKLVRESKTYFIKIPFESRLQFILQNYGQFKAEDLITATYRIQKRLGGLETKNAINHIIEKDYQSAFSILLKYYDKWYDKNRTIIPIEAESVDHEKNATLLLSL
jgi:tRNA 2-selenouridine synthase